VATKNSKIEKNITIKCYFRGKYREVQKHPIAEKRRQTSSRHDDCPFEIYGENIDGKCRFVVKVPNHISKTCPERSRIMVIQRPVLEEPAKEGTSEADPVSYNNSCSRKRRTVICGTCGGNHYRNKPY